jgi:trans-aconitate 2-methyltransferase
MDKNAKTDWNPELYLRFRNERTQPSIDLVSRINIANPGNIIDIGCGPGNSTRVLRDRWPESRITGLDNSPGMIEKAKSDYPGQEWLLGDASTFSPSSKYSLVFSNATIQWIPDHEKLISRWFGFVEDNGALAVQLPKFRDMPLGLLIEMTSGAPKWKKALSGCAELFTYHDYGFYYDLLAGKSSSMELWETSYIHQLDSHEAVLEWSRGTGLKPYLDRLSEALKKEFERELLSGISKAYPAGGNGKVLFPFKRLFFIAYK